MHENGFKGLWTVEYSLAKCMQAFLVLEAFDVDSVAGTPFLLITPQGESYVCRAWPLRLS